MAFLSESLRSRLPLFYVFLSGVGFSLQTLIIKMLAEIGFHGSFQCVFCRGVVQIILASYFVYWDEDRRAGKGPALFGDTYFVMFMLFARSVVGYGSIAFDFLAVELIPIGDTVVLVMLSPLLASILSYFLLGEPWRIPELCATIMSLTGAVMVAKPPFLFGQNDEYDSTFYSGVGYALTSACCAALAFISVRVLGTTAKMPWAFVCFSQAIGQIILALISLYAVGQTLTLNVSLYVAGLLLAGGVIGAWSQILMTIGMQREKSATATAMRMSDVAFGFLWQVLFTSDKLSLLSLGGAILVTISILIIVVFKENPNSGASGSGSSVEMAQMKNAIHDIAESMSTLEDGDWADSGLQDDGDAGSDGKGGAKKIDFRALRASLAEDEDGVGGGSGGMDVSAHGVPDLLLPGQPGRSAGVSSSNKKSGPAALMAMVTSKITGVGGSSNGSTSGGGYASLPQTES